MHYPILRELPVPAKHKTGWPWTEESERLQEKMPDGQPWPKMSIVTPSYNQGRFIEETIRSVLLQGYPNLEYIIIDGGSTDNSVEIIKKYSPWLTYWVSESDRGQSHAINKGLAHCSGDIFNWINSDDLLCPSALRAVAAAWRKTSNSIIAGPVVDFKPDGTERIIAPNGLTMEKFLNIKKARENSWIWHQPGTYLPLSEVKMAGGVREELRFTMDHFLMVDLLQRCNVVYIPELLAKFRLHNKSKTMTFGFCQFDLERVKALRAMNGLEEYVTAKELKEEYISLLITIGAIARREGSKSLAFKYITKAILLSPCLVMSELLRRDFFRRLLRKLGRTFIRTSKNSADS